MSLFDFLMLAGAGFLSGALNAVAGGGTFFTFAALVAAGLPPITANASSAVALTIGSVASAAAYRRELTALWRGSLWLALASGAGALIGALILIAIDDVTFRGLIPWLLLFATIVFALGPRIAIAIGATEAGRPTLHATACRDGDPVLHRRLWRLLRGRHGVPDAGLARADRRAPTTTASTPSSRFWRSSSRQSPSSSSSAAGSSPGRRRWW